MLNAYLYATDERMAKIRPALAPHAEHEVSVNGFYQLIPVLEYRTDNDLAQRYMGHSVRCLRCNTCVSDAWNA